MRHVQLHVLQLKFREENGNKSVENRNSTNFDNKTKCFEMLTNTITACFQRLKSDMAELVCEKSDIHYVDNNYESNTMTVDDLLSKIKLSVSIYGKPDFGKNEWSHNSSRYL